MRRAHFANQRDLASAARMDTPKMSMVLKGTRHITLVDAYRLAKVLEVDIGALAEVLGVVRERT